MRQPRQTTVAVISLGCPKALVDSEKMLALLAEGGCLVGAPVGQAEVILINTCAFIEPARRESYETIRQAVALKAAGSARRIVVAGCLPQREADRLRAEVPGVDAIIGVFERDRVLAAVTGDGRLATTEHGGGVAASSRPGAEKMVTVPNFHAGGAETMVTVPNLLGAEKMVTVPNLLDDRGRFRLTARHTAYLRLSEGCSAGCSYCTIPAIRGPLRSKPLAEVLAEAGELAADGAVEINLIAQDTTAYGRDLDDGADLAAALRGLERIDALRWVRVLYAHPATMTDAMIDAMAECGRVVKYLDLPLQHISDRILHRMRRRYDRRRVEALLDRLRRAMPEIALRTTFIAGFPGERREDFAELREFVAEQRFAAVGVFAYCREDGTPAAKLDGQVPARTAERRRERLMLDQQEIAFAAGAAAVGRELEVLVDGTAGAPARCVGRHAGQAPEIDGVCYLGGTDKRCLLVRGERPTDKPNTGLSVPPASGLSPGRIIRARVIGYDGYDLLVEPLEAMK